MDIFANVNDPSFLYSLYKSPLCPWGLVGGGGICSQTTCCPCLQMTVGPRTFHATWCRSCHTLCCTRAALTPMCAASLTSPTASVSVGPGPFSLCLSPSKTSRNCKQQSGGWNCGGQRWCSQVVKVLDSWLSSCRFKSLFFLQIFISFHLCYNTAIE